MKRLFSLTALILCIVMMLSLMPLGVSAAEFAGDDRIVIVLDPGHGTAGPANEYNFSEGAFNMRTARYMKAALEANSSFVVYMTNEAENVNLSFYERVSMADSVNADLIISVHYNASEANVELRGMEAWASVLPKFAMDDLATMCIEYATAAVPEIPGRGVYHRKDSAGFYWNETYQWDVQGDASSGVLSDHYSMITYGAKFGIPTFIIEELFLTNPADVALATDANIKAVAEAQAQAIIDYYTGHEHTYGELQTDIPLSCVSAGKQSRHCTVCGHRKDVSTVADTPDPDGHFYQPVDMNDLKGAWYCVYTRSLKEKAKLNIEEHTGDSLEGIDMPTPVPPAEALPTPPVAEPPSTPPTGEDGHEHKYKITGGFEVTGGRTGLAVYTCSVCGHKYSETLYATYDCEKNGHVLMPYSLVGWEYLPEGFVLPYVDVATTCEGEGKKYSFCMVCSYAGDDIEAPFGHTLEEINRVEPTCKDEGTVEYNCTVCNKRVAEKIPAIGHDMKVVEEIAATSDKEGKRVESCSVCGHTETVVIPMLPVDVTEPADVETTEASTAVTVEEEKKIDLPLPVIAVIVLVILFVAAILIVPVIIRRRKATIVPEVMDFADGETEPETENDAPVADEKDAPVVDEKDKELMSSVIPEIAQVVEAEPVGAGFSLEKIEIPVDAEDNRGSDTPREDALEALKLSFSELEESEENKEIEE